MIYPNISGSETFGSKAFDSEGSNAKRVDSERLDSGIPQSNHPALDSEALSQPLPLDFMAILHVLNSGYITRNADRQLFDALSAQQFCAVFAPPQSGKSSLLQQVSAQLIATDTVCLTIDLAKASHSTLLQPDNPSPQRLMAEVNPYGHLILSELWHGITDLPPDHLPFWLSTHPTNTILAQLEQLIEEILLVHCEQQSIVIFVDGLDAHMAYDASIQELLTLIRRCHNRRDHDPIYQKLTFCLLGDANPEIVMRDSDSDHSPLPFCQFVQLQGFSSDQAIEFLPILAEVVANPYLAIRMIVQLTGGQPLLTHRLCHLVRTHALTLADPQTFDLNTIPDLVKRHMPDIGHFQRICDRLHQSGPLLELCLTRYQRLLLDSDCPMPFSELDDTVATELCLSGLVVRNGYRLAIANPIYQDIFDRQWLLDMFNQHRTTYRPSVQQ